MKYLNIIICLLFPTIILAQNAEQDFIKLNWKYNELESFSCTINYAYYNNFEGGSVVDALSGLYFKSGKRFKFELGNSTIISDSIMTLNINTSEKQIVINPSYELEQIPLLNLKSLKKEIKLMEQIKSENQSVTYRYKPENAINFGIAFTDIQINTESWLVERIVIYYKNASVIKDGQYILVNPRIEMSYSDYKENTGLGDDFFSINEIIQSKESKYIGIGEYAKYEITQL